MKTRLMLIVLLITGFIMSGSISNSALAQTTKSKMTKETKMTKDQEVKYSCPVHPDVVQSEPGKCPKCGMQLTAMNTMQMKDSTNMKHDHKKMKKDTTMMKKDKMKSGKTMKDKDKMK